MAYTNSKLVNYTRISPNRSVNRNHKIDTIWCEIVSGELTLKEAEAARWLAKDELGTVQWLPADLALIRML